MTRCATFLIVVIFLVSCVGLTKSNNTTLASWEGARQDELIQVWGKPDEVIRHDEGSQTLVYHAKRNFTPLPHTAGELPHSLEYDGFRRFHVNKEGIIEGWSWEGW